ncbi:MAG: potassium-transporting ATPase subunit KdpA, partial [Actinomycetota bacterium]|nr:potassium-transporting ATPase subunit KdpA [Actinomycetota bacterium]
MSANGWLQVAVFVVVLTALTPVLGAYIARVYTGQPLLLERVFGPLERLVYRLLGPSARTEQDWKAYAKTTIVFSGVFFVVLYVILRSQGIQPFNPEGFDSGTWDVSFNTTASFISNTNWQFYGGETTLSYFSQMAGLAVQNFVSAAVGMAVLAAVIRGFISRGAAELGNFWRDVTRTLLYILLPISFLGALVLVSQGVVQTLTGTATFETLTGGEQSLALGPAASQISIKQLGTNGGGFFNVNSSFPFENPTQFSNFVEVLFILLIPASLTATFGRMVGNRRQGWAIYAAMLIMLVATMGVGYAAEQNGSPAQREAGIEVDAGATDVDVAGADEQTGGNLEGKEQRNGIVSSSNWAAITTAASNGSVNSALDSYTGIGGLVPMFNMLTGEVIFGGVGSGLYGMLLFVLLAVFIAGLMVGRTPEYLGKKISAREIKLASLYFLVTPTIVLA